MNEQTSRRRSDTTTSVALRAFVVATGGFFAYTVTQLQGGLREVTNHWWSAAALALFLIALGFAARALFKRHKG